MSAVTFVDDARDKSRWLVNQESRGPGDTRGAMERVSRRYGIPFSVLWSLRYRNPNDILVSAYFAIIQAHEAECDRQARLIEHERACTTPRTRIGRALLRAAATLDGSRSEALTAAPYDGGEQ